MKTTALLLAALCTAAPAAAQTVIPYPWHNRVAPAVTADVSLDGATGDFVYRYTVANGAAAEQRIDFFFLASPQAPSGAAAPTDWKVFFRAGNPDVAWSSSGTVDPAWVPNSEGDVPAFLSDVAPGASLAGFELRSPCAAVGPATFYAQGYNHAPILPDDSSESDPAEPSGWQQDAVQGQVVGPGDCSAVLDWGNRRPGVDGFMGVVNFASGATLPDGPATVQVRFSRSGEQVDVATFHAELNQQDVTASFAANSRGDRVAVFAPGSSAVQHGKNVLLLSVVGVKPGTTQTATDADRFVFTLP
jgi:hypothetical protein